MPLEGEYEPSPWEPIALQVEQYEASGGREGGEMEGAPCVILTTLGRNSGRLRKTPLIRVERDGRYAVIASMGGAPTHPLWFHNLVANPLVMLQDGEHVGDFVARTVEGAERDEWWAASTEVWPAYDDYQRSTDRVIPVVVLEPVE
jgi:F420H(2)-dependent quinone reductase